MGAYAGDVGSGRAGGVRGSRPRAAGLRRARSRSIGNRRSGVRRGEQQHTAVRVPRRLLLLQRTDGTNRRAARGCPAGGDRQLLRLPRGGGGGAEGRGGRHFGSAGLPRRALEVSRGDLERDTVRLTSEAAVLAAAAVGDVTATRAPGNDFKCPIQ